MKLFRRLGESDTIQRLLLHCLLPWSRGQLPCLHTYRSKFSEKDCRSCCHEIITRVYLYIYFVIVIFRKSSSRSKKSCDYCNIVVHIKYDTYTMIATIYNNNFAFPFFFFFSPTIFRVTLLAKLTSSSNFLTNF